MKLNYDLLHEENVKLKSQLDYVNKTLEQLQVEHEKFVEKYGEMKDEKQHDIATQTDSVCKV